MITLVLVGATLALAACGDGDTGGQPAPQPPPTDQSADEPANEQREAGGSGSEPVAENDAPPLSREEFAREANLICAEATRAIAALPASNSFGELAQNVPALQDIALRELDRLRALGQPTEQSERLDATYFLLLERQLELLGELGEATVAEDLVRARETLADAAGLNLQAAQIATAYGLDQCTGAAEVDGLADLEPAAPATPVEAFVAAADIVCRDSRAKVAALREPQTVEESAEVLGDIVDISSAELVQLRQLEPPAELAERYAEMLVVREEQIAALEVFGDALRADDRDAAGEALLESSGLNAEAERLQQELGLELCGAPPVQEVPNQRRVPDPSAGSDEPS